MPLRCTPQETFARETVDIAVLEFNCSQEADIIVEPDMDLLSPTVDTIEDSEELYSPPTRSANPMVFDTRFLQSGKEQDEFTMDNQ